jgi:branched-subunit amino acid ABC-type transport system permease component
VRQAIVYGLISGSTYALIALGFALVFSVVRFFNFAHGAVFSAGAYLNYGFYVTLGLPFWLSAMIAVFVAAVLGVSFEFLVFKRIRERGGNSLVLLIASLGLLISVQNIIAMVFGNEIRTVRSGLVEEGFSLFGARITSIQCEILLTSLVLVLVTAAILRWTKIGIALRAVANDPELATTKGIESQNVIYFTYLLGSALAAAAGIMVSLDVNMNPTMGFDALLYAIVAVIAGGLGSMSGAYLGGLLLGLAQNLGIWQIPSQWKDAIAFAVMILFLLLRPRGMFGKRIFKAQV